MLNRTTLMAALTGAGLLLGCQENFQVPETQRQNTAPDTLQPVPGSVEASGLPPAMIAEMVRNPSYTVEATISRGESKVIDQVREVEATFRVKGSPPTETFNVEFLAPGGNTFMNQRLKVAPAGSSNTRVIKLAMPVAGTAIQTGNLAGTWTARLTVGSAYYDTAFLLTNE